MKIFSVIALLVYWSVIILAPVIAKEQGKFSNNIIYPKKNLVGRPSAANIKNSSSRKRIFFRGKPANQGR